MPLPNAVMDTVGLLDGEEVEDKEVEGVESLELLAAEDGERVKPGDTLGDPMAVEEGERGGESLFTGVRVAEGTTEKVGVWEGMEGLGVKVRREAEGSKVEDPHPEVVPEVEVEGLEDRDGVGVPEVEVEGVEAKDTWGAREVELHLEVDAVPVPQEADLEREEEGDLENRVWVIVPVGEEERENREERGDLEGEAVTEEDTVTLRVGLQLADEVERRERERTEENV